MFLTASLGLPPVTAAAAARDEDADEDYYQVSTKIKDPVLMWY